MRSELAAEDPARGDDLIVPVEVRLAKDLALADVNPIGIGGPLIGGQARANYAHDYWGSHSILLVYSGPPGPGKGLGPRGAVLEALT